MWLHVAAARQYVLIVASNIRERAHKHTRKHPPTYTHAHTRTLSHIHIITRTYTHHHTHLHKHAQKHTTHTPHTPHTPHAPHTPHTPHKHAHGASCMYEHLCMYTCICTCVCVHARARARVCVCVCDHSDNTLCDAFHSGQVCVQQKQGSTGLLLQIHVRTRARTHARTHARTQTHICAHTYTQIERICKQATERGWCEQLGGAWIHGHACCKEVLTLHRPKLLCKDLTLCKLRLFRRGILI